MGGTKKLDRIKELTGVLREAAKAYYSEDREIMPNLEYDRLYEELASLERETGVVMAGSPTAGVGHEALSELPKEAHPSPMLSLDKTKDVAALKDWLGDKRGLLSWKLDGLTIALSYAGGALSKAVTRGNGQVGEVVTANARTFTNLPLRIPFKGELLLRGEAVISYSDFERINEAIEDLAQKYKNPRNLCSGSVRQLNSEVTAARRVGFHAFSLVSAGPPPGEAAPDFRDSREEQMKFLAAQGFQVVGHAPVAAEDVEEAVRRFSAKAADGGLPSDGLVLAFDSLEYGASLGSTSKFPKDSIAFKWEDELAETVLRDIEWNASRTGLINPVAIFDPVELEGTTVGRASVHNLSIVEELRLGEGDRITVYKANMIIPQIAENLTGSGPVRPPAHCPACGGGTSVRDESGVRFLYCANGGCPAKKLKALAHFVSRDAMNIEGLSEASLEKLVAAGLVQEAADIFRLGRHRDEIAAMEGFGRRSCENLLAAAEKARETTLRRFLYGLGVPGIGLANAGLICRALGDDWDRIKRAGAAELTEIDGIGEVMAEALAGYFANPANMAAADRAAAELRFAAAPERGDGGGPLSGLSFVITGGLSLHENRNALKAAIEAAGGKVTGSVTSKTDYLINNDPASGSSKNKTAKALGVGIIDEARVKRWMETGEGPE
ncbi:MAG: NAD-dependent DNA ligase LigA, partial [Clostridiales Family XIII bacterium]|nr:NAD-dependent DNA ligase LigA [Clostridiales Family XIII bacterium]